MDRFSNTMTIPPRHIDYDWQLPPPSRAEMKIVISTEEDTPKPIDKEFAEKLATEEIWRKYPHSKPAGGALEIGTVEWFNHLEKRRYQHQGYWIPKLFHVDRYSGQNIVVLSSGIGIEAVRFAQARPDQPSNTVHVCDPIEDRLNLVKAHFTARQLAGHFHLTPYDRLPLPDATVDVVSGILSETPPDLDKVIKEIGRILKPGGRLDLAVPAWRNANYWTRTLLFWRKWLGLAPNITLGFTPADLRAAALEFDDVIIRQRQLSRRELPSLLRWLSPRLLERVAGRYLILRAYKSIRGSLAPRIAA
ncbi:MAG: class I SAM-dependent methyltransferase [Gemmataceae bacterium]|nr:class I SAM-dependent methyltransferase [Gemmataceae bacterium]